MGESTYSTLSMDDEIESGSGAGMLPIALALLAIALGGAGLYFGMNASQQLSPLTDSVDAGTSSAARLEKQLSSIETRLTELSASGDELEKTVERLRIYGRQNEQTLKQVASAANANRREIVTLADRLKEVAARMGSGGGAANSGSSGGSGSSGEESDSAETANRGSIPGIDSADSDTDASYTIRAGDTFAKIAIEKGVSLNALIDANPDVDTRRLQIGQVIQLP